MYAGCSWEERYFRGRGMSDRSASQLRAHDEAALSPQGRVHRGYSHRRNRPQSCHSCSELTDITSSRQRACCTNGPCESLRWAPPRRDSRSIESPHVPRRDSRGRESPRGAPPQGATQVAVSRTRDAPAGRSKGGESTRGNAMRSPSAARDRERLRGNGSKTLKPAGGALNPIYSKTLSSRARTNPQRFPNT